MNPFFAGLAIGSFLGWWAGASTFAICAHAAACADEEAQFTATGLPLSTGDRCDG